jgi:hypothetical protein
MLRECRIHVLIIYIYISLATPLKFGNRIRSGRCNIYGPDVKGIFCGRTEDYCTQLYKEHI